MADGAHGSLAAEAAAYLEKSAGAMGRICGFRQQIGEQAEQLVEWAKIKGIFLTDLGVNGWQKYERTTAEHEVYFGPKGTRVIKCTKPGEFGLGCGPRNRLTRLSPATPMFYLERLDLMNRVFSTDLRLEYIGLGTTHYGTEAPYIVTSQSFIERADGAHPHPSQEEIDSFMMALEFELLPDSVWNWHRQRDNVLVFDTKELNFINSPEGIVPIDVIVCRRPENLEA